MIITFWQYRNACATSPGLGCYNVRDPLDLALISRGRRPAPASGSCGGTPRPAKIFMGDTGSLALGGIIAGLSITSRTETAAVVLGALFVAEVTSVVVQIAGVPHHAADGCSGWRRSTTTSNWSGGRKPR